MPGVGLGAGQVPGHAANQKPSTGSKSSTHTTVNEQTKGNVYGPYGGVPLGQTPSADWDAIFASQASASNNKPPPGPNINPLGGVRRSGGGGGGGGVQNYAGIDQGTYDRWLATVGNYKPGQYEYTPYEWQNLAIDDYQGTGFYDYDGSQYDTARSGITEGVGAARDATTAAHDRSAAAYGGMGNAFAQGPQTRHQGTDPRIAASMKAFGGAGQGAANQNVQEGMQADAGLSSFYDLMAKGTDQYNSAMVNSVNGDRAASIQNLGQQEAALNLQVNMAEAKAVEQYKKDKWQYGEQIAQQNYAKNMQVAMANNAGQNQVGQANNQGLNQANQANVLSGNQFDQQALTTLMELWQAGMVDGKQTLELGGGNGAHILQNIWSQDPKAAAAAGLPAPGAATRPKNPDPNRTVTEGHGGVTLGMSA